MTDEFNDVIGRYESELAGEKLKTQQANISASMFAQQGDQNLIEYQLDLDNILERLENLLRGKVLKSDKDGNFFYEDPISDDLKPFNEFGVQFLMNVITFYLNRNTILSHYTDERINKILYDFGYELADQISLNSKAMGLDTPAKKQRYPLIVLQVVHMLESTYRRALNGEEKESLRTARTVMQSDSMGSNQYSHPQQKKSFLKPKTWFGGV